LKPVHLDATRGQNNKTNHNGNQNQKQNQKNGQKKNKEAAQQLSTAHATRSKPISSSSQNNVASVSATRVRVPKHPFS